MDDPFDNNIYGAEPQESFGERPSAPQPPYRGQDRQPVQPVQPQNRPQYPVPSKYPVLFSVEYSREKLKKAIVFLIISIVFTSVSAILSFAGNIIGDVAFKTLSSFVLFFLLPLAIISIIFSVKHRNMIAATKLNINEIGVYGAGGTGRGFVSRSINLDYAHIDSIDSPDNSTLFINSGSTRFLFNIENACVFAERIKALHSAYRSAPEKTIAEAQQRKNASEDQKEKERELFEKRTERKNDPANYPVLLSVTAGRTHLRSVVLKDMVELITMVVFGILLCFWPFSKAYYVRARYALGLSIVAFLFGCGDLIRKLKVFKATELNVTEAGVFGICSQKSQKINMDYNQIVYVGVKKGCLLLGGTKITYIFKIDNADEVAETIEDLQTAYQAKYSV